VFVGSWFTRTGAPPRSLSKALWNLWVLGLPKNMGYPFQSMLIIFTQLRPTKASKGQPSYHNLGVSLCFFLRRHPSVSPNWAIAIQRQMRQGSSIRTKEASRRVLVRKRSTRHDLPRQSGFEVWQDMEGWQAALEGEHHKGNGEVRVFFAFFGIKTI